MDNGKSHNPTQIEILGNPTPPKNRIDMEAEEWGIVHSFATPLIRAYVDHWSLPIDYPP